MGRISLFNGIKPEVVEQVMILDTLRRIAKEKKLKVQIEAIRTIKDKKRRNESKKKLQAVTWSGSFSHREADKLLWHSGIICIDIDNLPLAAMAATAEQLRNDKYVYAFFIGPSGNGFKVLFQTDLVGETKTPIEVTAKQDAHKDYWIRLAYYIENNYGTLVEADAKCKDVSRLCFLSYDEQLYIADTCETVLNLTFPLPPDVEKEKAKSNAKPTQQLSYEHTNEQFNDIRKFTDNKYTYAPGSRNEYINIFCINCKLRGIDIHDLESYCLNEFTDYEAGMNEVVSIMRSVYANNKFPFGSKQPYQRNQGKQQPQRSNKPAPTDAAIEEDAEGYAAEGFNTETLFWYTIEKANKDTGEVTEEVKFSYEDGITFLENNGFCKLPMDNGAYQFVRIKNNVVEPVNIMQMRSFMLALLKTKPVAYKKAREMFRRGSKQYSAQSYLEGLKDVKPQFHRDTKDAAHYYFRNCWVEVTATGITTKQYSELKGCIWAKQKHDRDFRVRGENEPYSVFQDFIQCAIIGRRLAPGETFTEREQKMMQATWTAIGYMPHGYKDPINVKCVILVDKSKRSHNDSNGRSGKTLMCKALGYAVPRCVLDGRNFKWDGRNPFDKLNLDHRILHFDDIPKNFDFERTYSLTTEDFTYNKMYQDSITIPFEDSPKIMITTNTSLRASGESAKARQHIIEFSNFFNSEHTPYKEFGRRFFNEWDENEWNLFDNFMIEAVRLYLEIGLVPFPLENYEENKLVDDIGFDELEWIESRIMAAWSSNTRQEKKALFNDFLAEFRNKQHMKMNTFTKWLEQVCKLRGYVINGHKKGERDKSGSIEYLTFTKPQNDIPKPEEEAF